MPVFGWSPIKEVEETTPDRPSGGVLMPAMCSVVPRAYQGRHCSVRLGYVFDLLVGDEGLEPSTR